MTMGMGHDLRIGRRPSVLPLHQRCGEVTLRSTHPPSPPPFPIPAEWRGGYFGPRRTWVGWAGLGGAGLGWAAAENLLQATTRYTACLCGDGAGRAGPDWAGPRHIFYILSGCAAHATAAAAAAAASAVGTARPGTAPRASKAPQPDFSKPNWRPALG